MFDDKIPTRAHPLRHGRRRFDHAGSNCALPESGDLRADPHCILGPRPAPHPKPFGGLADPADRQDLTLDDVVVFDRLAADNGWVQRELLQHPIILTARKPMLNCSKGNGLNLASLGAYFRDGK